MKMSTWKLAPSLSQRVARSLVPTTIYSGGLGQASACSGVSGPVQTWKEFRSIDRRFWEAKNTFCFCRGPGHVVTHNLLWLQFQVIQYLFLASTGTGHRCDAQIYIQTKHPYAWQLNHYKLLEMFLDILMRKIVLIIATPTTGNASFF